MYFASEGKARGRTVAHSAGRIILAGALLAGVMGVSCDENAQAVFRQSATEPIASGIKAVLSGNPADGIGAIVSAAIDGWAESIIQAGDGPAPAK